MAITTCRARESDHPPSLLNAEVVTLIAAEGDGVVEKLDPRVLGDSARQLAHSGRSRQFSRQVGVVPQVAAQRWLFIDENYVDSRVGGREGRGKAGQSSPDDGHVCKEVHLVVFAVAAVLAIDLAQSGDPADDFLPDGPHPARPEESLVVETDRHEAAELVEDCQDIESDRGPRVLRADDGPRLRRRRANPNVRDAVHRAQAVGAAAGAAEESAGAMIFEAAREDVFTRGVESAGDRLTFAGVYRLAVEIEPAT